MSLLPDVERELLRVARLPLPGSPTETTAEPAPPDAHAHRRRRPSPSSFVVLAVALLALAIAAVFLSALRHGATPPTGNRSSAGIRGAAFPGAPQSQSFEPDTGVCPLAARNRYLPPRSGCVTALRADLAGDGLDLVLLYSSLSEEHGSQAGPAASQGGTYLATSAYVKLVRVDGAAVVARISGAHAVALLAAARVNDAPGDELFVQVSHTSSGNDAVAYGFDQGRLVPAGPTLFYGGDSGSKGGFNCLSGASPRLLQRGFVFLGATIYGSYTETDRTYVWHGPRLTEIAKRTFTSRGQPPRTQIEVGPGCIAGIGSYPLGGGRLTVPASIPAGASVSVSSTGIGGGGVISAVTRWRGRLYAAGSDYGPSLTCPGSCEPLVWIWNSHLRRWRAVFTGPRPAAGGSEFLMGGHSALLVFTTGDGTKLWRSLDGRRYTTIALPAPMGAGTVASVYLAGETIVAVVGHSSPSAYVNAPAVWLSADGAAWRPIPAPVGSGTG